tara:strand:+ start:400 stop:579 length:180 start_codon:yes stop_codon:yes gene_type:complete
MALSKEFIEAVKQIAKELELNSQFEKTFLAHLEKESEYQVNEDDRLATIALLRDELRKK